jgi:hypothetical protein
MGLTMHETDKYREFRKQLGEHGLSFQRAATQFPSSFYEFVEANSPLSVEDWNRWILENRTASELQRQHWDIYPSGWAIDHEKVFQQAKYYQMVYSNKSGIGSDRTRICGVLHSPSATLEAAQAELEQLSETGIEILLAIRNEIRKSPSLNDFAILPTLPDGHRGWLDLVRQTAEDNRGVSLKVNYHIFNVPRDSRSQFLAMKHSLSKKHDATTNETSPADSAVCRVTPDIFSASANAIRIWLDGKQDEPIVSLVCPGLTIPDLPAPDDCQDNPDETKMISSVEEPEYSSDARSPMDWTCFFGLKKTPQDSRRLIAMFKDGTYLAKQSTSKKWRIAINDLPASHPESPRYKRPELT